MRTPPAHIACTPLPDRCRVVCRACGLDETVTGRRAAENHVLALAVAGRHNCGDHRQVT